MGLLAVRRVIRYAFSSIIVCVLKLHTRIETMALRLRGIQDRVPQYMAVHVVLVMSSENEGITANA